ncbi:MAG: preprotein translocase subunit SecE [Planctomycetota bacterium]
MPEQDGEHPVSWIYKPSQGYWTRAMTAVFAGALTLSMAVWAYNQAALLPLPTPSYRISLGAIEGGTPQVGDTVTLIDTGVDPVENMGTGVVEEFDPSGDGRGDALIGQFAFVSETTDPSVTGRVETLEGASNEFRASVIGNPRGVEAVNRQAVQSGVAVIALMAGALATLMLVGRRKRSAEFLINTDGEMKKVNWSTKREIYGSTVVVIVATFLIAGILFTIDYGFSWVFRQVGVLDV